MPSFSDTMINHTMNRSLLSLIEVKTSSPFSSVQFSVSFTFIFLGSQPQNDHWTMGEIKTSAQVEGYSPSLKRQTTIHTIFTPKCEHFTRSCTEWKKWKWMTVIDALQTMNFVLCFQSHQHVHRGQLKLCTSGAACGGRRGMLSASQWHLVELNLQPCGHMSAFLVPWYFVVFYLKYYVSLLWLKSNLEKPATTSKVQ